MAAVKYIKHYRIVQRKNVTECVCVTIDQLQLLVSKRSELQKWT